MKWKDDGTRLHLPRAACHQKTAAGGHRDTCNHSEGVKSFKSVCACVGRKGLKRLLLYKKLCMKKKKKCHGCEVNTV